MVNLLLTIEPGQAATIARNAEWQLILSYAAADRRASLDALLALDRTLGDVLRATSEPMLAQMRFTWWHESLTRLDTAPPPAMPLLQTLATDVLPLGISGAALASLVEGWEALIEGEPTDPAVRAAFARGRGSAWFGLAASALGANDPRLDAVGRGWALADLSRRVTDRDAAAAASEEARGDLATAFRHRWPARLRALSALAVQAAMDLRTPVDQPLPAATPRRVARLGWHRLTGR